MQEYNRLDAAFYDLYSTGLEGDAAFYVEQAVAAQGPVLELGCGTGRITLPIAEAGVEIVGVDRSPEMLEIARNKLAKADKTSRERVSLVEADMRDVELGRRFALVIIPYRAFLHLLSPEEQRQALATIGRHLESEGRLAFNIFDPHLGLIAAHSGPLGAAIKRLDREFTHPVSGNRVLVFDTRRYDPTEQMLHEYHIFEEIDAAGHVRQKTYVPLTLRYVYRYEMQYLLNLCGFKVEALYGDFAKGPFRHGGEQIWIARPSS